MSDSRMAGQRESASGQGDIEPLLSGYRPLPGIFDEMVDREGHVRAHWQPLLAMLARLGPSEIGRRFAAADRHLRDSGVFYRVYEDASGAERPWPLSHLPLLIDAAEWQALKAGLVQRAELLEAVLADAYGPANLVREGRLPAVVIAGNPEFHGRWSGSRRQAARICGFMPSTSGVRPEAIAASRCRASCPRSIAGSRSSGWRRSSKLFRPSFPRSIARKIRGSACSRRAHE